MHLIYLYGIHNHTMKKIAVIILLLVSIAPNSFSQKKKMGKETITQIEMELFSRRGRTELAISKDSAISIGRTDKQFILLTTKQWNRLVSSLKGVKLPGIALLVSPTKDREFDGAQHCKISISTKKNKYESQYFDEGKPMKKMQRLYDAIAAIRNEINNNGKPLGQ